jgi:hypothetical protein
MCVGSAVESYVGESCGACADEEEEEEVCMLLFLVEPEEEIKSDPPARPADTYPQPSLA